jgi:hypothetical protein
VSSEFISKRDRLKGLRRYSLFVFANGIGYTFLAETIIYLMAIHFGASNLQLGYISSAIYLTGASVMLVPFVFGGRRLVDIFFWSWLIRGLVCLLYFAVPFVGDRSVLLIMAIYSLYCLLRNIAWPMNLALQRSIVKPSASGRMASTFSVILNYAMLISRTISYLVLAIKGMDGIRGILILEGVGVIINSASAFIIKSVPVHDTVERRGVGGMIRFFLTLIKNRNHALVMSLYWLGVVLLVLFGFNYAFLKTTVGLSNSAVFAYTIVTALATIVCSSVLKPVLDRIGSKPILTITYFMVSVVSLLWSMIPPEFPALGLFLLGFVSMFFLGGIRVLLERLILKTVSKREKVSYTAILSLIAALVALFAGLLGGYFGDLSARISSGVVHGYSLTFMLMALASSLSLVLSLYLDEPEAVPLRSLLQTLFKIDNLAVFLKSIKLDANLQENRKEIILMEISGSYSALATSEIRKRLQVPLMREKELTIRSLFAHPRPELVDELLDEAQDKHSWWRQSALFALGAYPGKATEKVLLKAFSESYPYLRSIAAKSLARIGNTSIYEQIREALQNPNLAPRTVLNFLIAESILDKDRAYLERTFLVADPAKGHRFCQSVFIIYCKRFGFLPSIEHIFLQENLAEGRGVKAVLDDMLEIRALYPKVQRLETDFSCGRLQEMIKQCRVVLEPLRLPSPYHQLQQAILSYRRKRLDNTHLIAILYFTLHLCDVAEIIENALKQEAE